jgi:hypothetical protein
MGICQLCVPGKDHTIIREVPQLSCPARLYLLTLKRCQYTQLSQLNLWTHLLNLCIIKETAGNSVLWDVMSFPVFEACDALIKILLLCAVKLSFQHVVITEYSTCVAPCVFCGQFHKFKSGNCNCAAI